MIKILKLIPNKLLSIINSYRIEKQKANELKESLNWFYGKLLLKREDSDTLLKRILLRYHVIEKGLTMPERRNGFGKDVMKELVHDINTYIKKYGIDNEQIPVAIGVVAEYRNVHQKQGFVLDENLRKSIDTLLEGHNYPAVNQLEMTKDIYFSHINQSFADFSKSRHSLRNFSGKVNEENLGKAFQLAQNAPSACNRQATRITVISDKDIISKVFAIHRGNRGFGHLADKLIVLTTDMRYWEIKTAMGGYVDGGIYAMNLLYALHYYEIGACPLNACFTPEEEKIVRELTHVSDNENFVLFIAIGGVPENFALANSHRYDSHNLVKYL